jgi:thioredoxin reductase
MPHVGMDTGPEVMMAKTDAPRIAVLGAGPIGLEAAVYARSLNLPVTVYERGRAADAVHRWGHVRLFSPFGMNVTTLGRTAILTDHPRHEFPADTANTTGKEHITTYLDPLAKSRLLSGCLRTDTQVVQVARRGFLKEDGLGDAKRGQQPFRLLVREAKKTERIDEADVVLDCTGTYGQHRWLGDGGIPAAGEIANEAQIVYGLDDILGERRTFYQAKNVMVVGSGYSAATSICNLATLAEKSLETWTTWLIRGPGTQPIKRILSDPLKERDRLAVRANTLATRGEGNVEFHNQTVIDSVEWLGNEKGFRIGTRSAGKPRTWEVDRLIANVGYSPDTQLYRELQVHECYASLGPINLAAALLKAGGDCLTIPAQGANTLRNPEPNFFILGTKSYGRNSNFLLRAGFEQIREVFTLITGKPDLDLYKKR